MSQARQWLREELRDDREAIADKTATDWLVTIVDTIAAPALALRASVAVWVWAINHGTSADVGLSLAEPAMIAAAWGRVDALQTAALMWIVPALVVELPLCCRAVPPVVWGLVGLQGLAVAIEAGGVATGVRVSS